MRWTRECVLMVLLVGWGLSWGGAGCARGPDDGRVMESKRRPLVGGYPDPGHSAVGLVIMDGGACTGTLVSSRMVLTAAHCVSPEHPPKQFVLGKSYAEATDVVDIVEAFPHPWYNPEQWEQEQGKPWDLALLLLAQPLPVDPVHFRTDSMECLEGAPLTYVGYGLTVPKDYSSSGFKNQLNTVVGQVVEGGFWTHSIPGAPKNACPGDSGGPAIVTEGGRSVLVGVMSLADAWCEWESFCVRPDSHASWLMATIASHDPEGLPSECGDGVCEYLEDAGKCPADCSFGTGGLSDACLQVGDCKAGLFCRTQGESGFCTRWCAGPDKGTGCPCGAVCSPVETEPGVFAGVCVATGFPASNCGNGQCEAGEDSAVCPFDCLLSACGQVSDAGCCTGEIAAECIDGLLALEHCAGKGLCGFDAIEQAYTCGTDGAQAPEPGPQKACPPPPPKCGDGLCAQGEDQQVCPLDCLYPGFCGDGACNGYEDFDRCPADCLKGVCDVLPDMGCCEGDVAVFCFMGDQQMMSCQHHPQCGWDPGHGMYGCGTDGAEDPTGTLPKDCAAWSPVVCGDGECAEEETYETCPDDCPPPVEGCGDGVCGPGEEFTACPQDCFKAGCGKIMEEGCCDGAVVKQCIGSALFMTNCEDQVSCGWSAGDGYYSCGTSGDAEPTGKLPLTCAEVEAIACGDGKCQGAETKGNCPPDCVPKPVVICGDGKCDSTETEESCPEDCANVHEAVEEVRVQEVPGSDLNDAHSMAETEEEAVEAKPASGGGGGCTVAPAPAHGAFWAIPAILVFLCTISILILGRRRDL